MAELFAAQLAAALQGVEAEQAAGRLASQVAEAMRGRAVVEQAKGVLMAERGVGEAEAFRLLEAERDGASLVEAARLIVERRGS